MYRTKKLLAVLVAVIMALGILPCMSASAALTYDDYDFDSKTGTLLSYLGSGVHVAIPDKIDGTNVKIIGESAFENSSVESVSIPQYVTRIEKYAFRGCTDLEKIYIPAKVTTLRADIFEDCSSSLRIYAPSTSDAYEYAGDYDIKRGTATVNTMTLTFNANGGTVSPSSKTVTEDFEYGELPEPTRNGYTFEGWYTAKTTGNEVTPDTVVEKSSGHTIYAHWDSGSSSSTSGTLKVETFQPTNITTGSAYLSGRITSLGRYSVKKFGFEYRNVASGASRTVTSTNNSGFKANTTYGGTVDAFTPGNTYQVRAYAQDTAGNTAYGQWLTFTTVSGTTQYVTVTFNPNGGSVSQTAKTVVYGSPYGVLPVPTRSSYTFAGWYTASTGGTLVTEETQVTKLENHTLYARWVSGSIKVPTVTTTASPTVTGVSVTMTGRLSATGGSSVTDFGFEIENRLTGETKKYSLKKTSYSTGSYTGTVNGLEASTSYRFRAYAANIAGAGYGSWVNFTTGEVKTYTVTFNVNGGSSLPTDERTKKIAYGDVYGDMPVPTRSGYVFMGWYTGTGTTATLVTSSTVMNRTTNHTLYAQWKKGTASLPTVTTNGATDVKPKSAVLSGTLNSTGGAAVTEFGFEIKNVSGDRTVLVKDIDFSSVINSVNTAGTEGVIELTPGNSYQFRAYAVNGAGTGYGNWVNFNTPIDPTASITVTFNGGTGVTVTPATKQVTVGQPYGELPAPTRSGYVFGGWYTAADGGSLVTALSTVTATADHTLYARWVEAKNVAKLTVGSAKTVPGKNIVIPVTIENNPGIAGFKISFGFDREKLTPVSVTQGDGLPGGIFSGNTQEPGAVTAVWFNAGDFTGNGTILNLEFKTADGFEGEADITASYDIADVKNQAGESVGFDVTNGKITVASVVAGDVDGDGALGISDGIRICQHLADWTGISIDLNAADVNGDGDVNIFDGIRISQLLAGVSVAAQDSANRAAGGIDVSIGSVDAVPGAVIEVPVNITQNSGMAGFTVNITYDAAKLTPIGVEQGAAIPGGMFNSNILQGEDKFKPGEITVAWMNPLNTTGTGTAFTIRFRVASDAAAGVTDVAMSGFLFGDQKLVSLNVNNTDGGVNVVREAKPVVLDYEITSVDCAEAGGLAVVEVSLTKKTDRGAMDTLIIASYGKDGDFIDNVSLKLEGMKKGQTATVGRDIITDAGGKVKAFIWDSLGGMQALSNSVETAVTAAPDPGPQEPDPADPDVSELYNRMTALKADYPEGTPWTNANSYRLQGKLNGIIGSDGEVMNNVSMTGYGCAGFAFMLSDAAFGSVPAYQKYEVDFKNVRVGDILRVNGDTHSVIVLEVKDDSVVIAEGNYNNSVHWGRTLTADEVNAADYMITRYPQ